MLSIMNQLVNDSMKLCFVLLMMVLRLELVVTKLPDL